MPIIAQKYPWDQLKIKLSIIINNRLHSESWSLVWKEKQKRKNLIQTGGTIALSRFTTAMSPSIVLISNAMIIIIIINVRLIIFSVKESPFT